MGSASSLPGPVVDFDATVSVSETKSGPVSVLSGTVSAAAGLTELLVYDGTPGAPGTVFIGSAQIGADGTWSVRYFAGDGIHKGLQVVATDAQGQSTTAVSSFDLTTGVTGEPYVTVQDHFDPVSSDYLGSTYFQQNGQVYLDSTYAALPDGSIAVTYRSGSYFDGKAFSSYVETYDPDGTLSTRVDNNDDGSHRTVIEAGGQDLHALKQDAFVFTKGLGHETIEDFKVGGSHHDTIDLQTFDPKHPNADAQRLAEILAKAVDDGQGDTTIKLGHGDTITFAGVSVAALKKHVSDFIFHA